MSDTQSSIVKKLFESKKIVSKSVNESYSLKDIQDMPYSSSFMNDRAEINIKGKRYVKIGKNRWEFQSTNSRVLGYSITDKELYLELNK